MYTNELLPVFGFSDLFDTLNGDVKACSSCTPRATVAEKGGVQVTNTAEGLETTNFL